MLPRTLTSKSAIKRNQIFEHMGMLLVLTQQAEVLIRATLRRACGATDAFADLDAGDRRTMGALIHELERKVRLHHYFAEDLWILLRQRNDFIHHLALKEWFAPDDTTGLYRALAWMSHYQQRLFEITTVLLAYTEALPVDELKEDLRSVHATIGYPPVGELIAQKT
jgi:hypothetical protein